jgi:hypothetical protein
MALNKQVINWQKREGIALALFLSASYFMWFAGSIELFLLVIFVPDVFTLGYFRGNKFGAWFYNLGHTFILPPLLFLLGWLNGEAIQQHLAMIWTVHICLERALGYGLKTDKGFAHTHMGTIGSRNNFAKLKVKAKKASKART